MNTSARVDRAKILRFFAWSGSGIVQFNAAIGCVVASVWISYGGLAVVTRNSAYDWVLPVTWALAAVLIALAVLSFRSAVTRERRLRELRDEVTKAKEFDFARVLLRSFRKAGTRPGELLDTGAACLVSLDAEAVDPEDKELLETLTKKSVFLSARNGSGGDIKFLFTGNKLALEYSPIFVSILYLTASDLIIYSASVDLLGGAISLEDIHHVCLSDVVEVRVKPVISRLARAAHENLFTEYERVLKNNISNELVRREHSVHVIKTDGSALALPAGDAEFYPGKLRIPEAGGDMERLVRVAEAMNKKIAASSATAEL